MVRRLLGLPNGAQPPRIMETVVAQVLAFVAGMAILQAVLVIAGVRPLDEAIGDFVPSVFGAAFLYSMFMVGSVLGPRRARQSYVTESDRRS